MEHPGIQRLPSIWAERPLEEILRRRRTTRAFSPQPLSLPQVGGLLWAAQGVTSPEGYRAAPSAGALYPLEVHLAAGQVTGLAPGTYRYDPAANALREEAPGDVRREIAEAALGQHWIAEAPIVVILSGVYARTNRKYGHRGVRYVHMEVGHAGENLLLQAVALGLAAAVVGAFDDERLRNRLGLPDGEHPLAILPVGYGR
jgi:SagB-type dehydrogenase family enzyme